MPSSKHFLLRVSWSGTSVLFTLAVGPLSYSGGWNCSVRQYLKGFSGAVVPAARAPEQELETVLNWRNSGPAHLVAAHPAARSARDPETIDFLFGIPQLHWCKSFQRANATCFRTPGTK